MGSLRAVLSATGAVVHQIAYDTFGNILTETNSGLCLPFGFAGGLHDRATGLVRFGYRDYEPDTGRWTAKDPIGFMGAQTNLYGYCGQNPVNGLDPTGMLVSSFNFSPLVTPRISTLYNLRYWNWDVPGPYGSPDPADWGEGWNNIMDGPQVGNAWWGIGQKVAIGTAIGATAIAGGTIVWEGFGGPTMDIAVGPGVPFHVAYGTGGQWLNAVGSQLGALRVSSYLAIETAETAWFQLTGIPIANSAAVLTSGQSAGTCIGAAVRAFFRGWGF